MKARYAALFLSTLLLTLPTYAKQAELAMETSTQPSGTATTAPYFSYNNRMTVFDPFYMCYERTQVDALYWGLMEYVSPTIGPERHRWFLQSEVRMGWNFLYNERDHVTPYGGLVYMNDFGGSRHFSDSKDGIIAVEVGFLYDHEFNSVFTLGVNAKGFLGGSIGNHHEWGQGIAGGFDVGIPFTLRFGGSRHWDFRFEPFDVAVFGTHHTHNYPGLRSAFAYRF
jgi:hypothetical protein